MISISESTSDCVGIAAESDAKMKIASNSIIIGSLFVVIALPLQKALSRMINGESKKKFSMTETTWSQVSNPASLRSLGPGPPVVSKVRLNGDASTKIPVARFRAGASAGLSVGSVGAFVGAGSSLLLGTAMVGAGAFGVGI